MPDAKRTVVLEIRISVAKAEKNLKRVGITWKKVQRGILRGIKRLINNGFKKLGRAVKGVGKTITALGGRIQRTLGAFLIIGQVLAAWYAFRQAIIGSTKAWIEYERELANVNTLLRLGKDAITGYGLAVTEVAKSLGVKQAEALKATYFIISGGIRDTADALNVFTVSAKLAVAGLHLALHVMAGVLKLACDPSASTG